MLLKVSILISLHVCLCNSQLHVFETDYIGKSYSVEEYKKLDVCYSDVCLIDAKRFMNNMSHKNDSDSSVNYDEFACGHFYKYKAYNERYYSVGFENDIHRLYEDRLKRVLREKIHEDEPKIFKLLKSYYQKCVNSSKIYFNILF